MAKDPYLDKDGLETFYNLMKNRLSSYCKKDESFYVTTQANEDTIPIGISGFRSTDVLFVDINGLDLVAGEDYTIDGTDIVLETPISSSGQTVHFLALRAATVTAQDYSVLKGDPGDVSDVLLDGASVVDGAGVARLTSSALVDIFYPVGSYYETDNANFDPNTAWGGTWVQDSAGRVLVAYDSSIAAFDTIGETGGSKDAIVPYHNHTATGGSVGDKAAFDTGDQSANHTHGLSTYKYGSAGNGTGNIYHPVCTEAGTSTSTTGGVSANHHHQVPQHGHSFTQPTISYAGTNGNTTDANLQPYTVIYRWHRTA